MVRRYGIMALAALMLGSGITLSAQAFFPYAAWQDYSLQPPCVSQVPPTPLSHLSDVHLYYYCVDGRTIVRHFRGAPWPTTGAQQSQFPTALYPNGSH